MIKIIQIILLLLSLSTIADAKKEEIGPDHLALATMMVYDGKYDKATAELDAVDKNSPHFDASKYYTILGVIALKKEDYKKSIEALEKAVEETKTKVYLPPKSQEEKKKRHLLSFIGLDFKSDKKEKKLPEFHPEKLRKEKIEQLYLYLSRAYFKDKQYLKTVYSLDRAGEKGKDRAALFALRAECYWKADEKEKAIQALNKGSELFKEDKTLLRQKYYYFADLKLYQSAIKYAKVYMQKADATSKEYVSLAQMLITAGQEREAIKFLEEAKLNFPDNAKISMLLAYLYNKKSMSFVAANLYEDAAYHDSNYTKDAAEMYRRVGLIPHALYLNSKLTDKAEKIKQKIAIFVDRGEFEKVIGLKNALNRYGLLDNDKFRYALAYAYYVVKDYDNAEKYLKQIEDSELFSKATVIRKNIEKCKKNSEGCM